MSEKTETVNGWELSKLPEGFVFEWRAVSANKCFEDKFYSYDAAVKYAQAHDAVTLEEITPPGMSPR